MSVIGIGTFLVSKQQDHSEWISSILKLPPFCMWRTGAPWSTQAVVEWMTSVQLELLRSGRSKRMTEQLSRKAIEKLSHDDQQQDILGTADGIGQAPHFVGQK